MESQRIDLQIRGRSGRQGDPECLNFLFHLKMMLSKSMVLTGYINIIKTTLLMKKLRV
ncbi:MAG: hypothetical protein ACLU93_00890 [Streptococcus sp.]